MRWWQSLDGVVPSRLNEYASQYFGVCVRACLSFGEGILHAWDRGVGCAPVGFGGEGARGGGGIKCGCVLSSRYSGKPGPPPPPPGGLA